MLYFLSQMLSELTRQTLRNRYMVRMKYQPSPNHPVSEILNVHRIFTIPEEYVRGHMRLIQHQPHNHKTKKMKLWQLLITGKLPGFLTQFHTQPKVLFPYPKFRIISGEKSEQLKWRREKDLSLSFARVLANSYPLSSFKMNLKLTKPKFPIKKINCPIVCSL